MASSWAHRKHGSTNFRIHEDSTDSDPSQGPGNLVGAWLESFSDLRLIDGSRGDKQGLECDKHPGPSDLHRPLTTSYLANQDPNVHTRNMAEKKHKIELPPATISIDPTDHISSANSPMDELLAKLAEQQTLLTHQTHELNTVRTIRASQASEPVSMPPLASFTHAGNRRSSDASEGNTDVTEINRLKQELEKAQKELARKDDELSQSRTSKHTLERAFDTPMTSEFGPISGLGIDCYPQYDAPGETQRTDNAHEHSSADGSFLNLRSSCPQYGAHSAGPSPQLSLTGSGTIGAPGFMNRTASPNLLIGQFPRNNQSLRLNTAGSMYSSAPEPSSADSMFRDNSLRSRPASAIGSHLQHWSPYEASFAAENGYTPPLTPMTFQQLQQGMAGNTLHPMIGYQGPSQYAPRPIGSALSPTAIEFNAAHSTSFSGPGPWNAQTSVGSETPASYLSTAEPMNYRRLLDRNMSCNWKYIVEKIVCNNDQQASIFLQQKLKIGTQDQKMEIIQAIIDQAYPLMVNRFGNFLVQRCFEHGTPEQIIAIARAIRGNTLNLSMDAFGCHVVQKAFDCVPEEYKAVMVHELLRRIPETVIHRYACHVWQKLFELRWSDSPPQIMKYVNEALRGMWHEVALGETGSLVVQNIFENCLEEDKRPCINEVLASIDVVAHGQFGNWCIQHICEHGSIPDRTRATDHVLRFATEYSMDQFASKVVEKCLKIGGSDFLDRYLDRVCEARADRPRMPLIDIAGDQFGNYLVQYILSNADPQRREVVASHIRKHMVSLRGSKYGSRVAMLCCNPASSTRPGPPVGLPLSRNGPAYVERPPYGERQYGGVGRGGPYNSGF